MKITKLTLKKFKRFDDLTINLGDTPARIVALVGPNGCGKSSIFDSFEEKQKDYKHAGRESAEFYSKSMFTDGATAEPYEKHQAIQIVLADGTQNFTTKSFHIRSAYRFTSKLNVESITAMPDILADPSRPISSIALDSRLVENYQRMLGIAYGEFEKKGGKTGDHVRAALMDKVNAVLKNVLDVQISSMGNVMERKGQLYFEKENAKDFPYQNLSAGEKEVIDIVLDLIVRAPEFNDTVYCIDEPELHLNTSIQRKLLIEIEKLIPDNCQLWMATHSIGFLRALQDELADKCAVLDFSDKDYFKGTHEIIPMKPTRANWQRIFSTALDDLVGLIAPRCIVYCEGRNEPGPQGQERGLDAIVYNEIFASAYPETLFISSGGSTELAKNSNLALKIISKAFLDVKLLLLRDRDLNTDVERQAFLTSDPQHRMLVRGEIENYLMDFAVLHAFCASKGRSIEKADYDGCVQDILMQDLKAGQIISQLKSLCGCNGQTNDDFKKSLAPFVGSCAAVYEELENCIFQSALSLASTLASTQQPLSVGSPAL
jgi:predicted ATPase